MRYVLSIDQGTSSTRSIVFDEHAEIVGSEQLEHQQIYPQSSWVEHDADEIMANVRSTMLGALQNAKLSWSDISCIGITNQRETVVAWDKTTGKPLYNAIVWQCRRTTPMINDLKVKGFEDIFFKKTGLVLDAYFSGTKIKWFLDNVKDIKRTEANNNLQVGTIDSWIIYSLTGKHRTDASNASRTLLFDIKTNTWSDELCNILDIDPNILPEVHPHCSEPFGIFNIDGYSIPITGVLGDQQAALFGQTAFSKGEMKTTYGTGNFALVNIGDNIEFSSNGLLTTVAWQIGENVTYALEGSVFISGAALSWLRDGLKLVGDYNEVDELAKLEDSANGVYFVPAFVCLGAPYWDSTARGTIVGITGGTNRSNIIHATLDAIALQTDDLITTMEKDSNLSITEMRVDGGITNSMVTMQKQANLSRLEVQVPKIVETTALGAAFIAGLGNIWADLETLSSLNPTIAKYTPNVDDKSIEKIKHDWHRAVKRSQKWIE